MKLYNMYLSNFASKCRIAIYEKGARVEIAPIPAGDRRSACGRQRVHPRRLLADPDLLLPERGTGDARREGPARRPPEDRGLVEERAEPRRGQEGPRGDAGGSGGLPEGDHALRRPP